MRPARPARRRSRRPTLVRIDIGAGTMLRVGFALALAWLAWQLWPIVLVIVVSLMAVGALSPNIAWLERQGFSRSWAIAVVFLATFAGFATFAVLTAPQLVVQLSHVVAHLPETQAQLAALLDAHALTAPMAASVRGVESSALVGTLAAKLLGYAGRIFELTAYAVTSVFLALYLIIDRDRMRGAAFALVPRRFHVRLSRILLNLESIVGGYVRGQMLTSILMALFAFVVLLVARVPNAVALAVFAGMADVLPYVGGILACAPAALAALPRGFATMATVVGALLVYQEFESRVIVPRVYGRALRLPSSVVVVALLVGGTLLGILGALLALPIAAGARMIIEELRFELPGEDGPLRPSLVVRDALAERSFAERAAGAPAEQAAAIATEIAERQIAEDALRGDPTEVPVTGREPPDE